MLSQNTQQANYYEFSEIIIPGIKVHGFIHAAPLDNPKPIPANEKKTKKKTHLIHLSRE